MRYLWRMFAAVAFAFDLLLTQTAMAQQAEPASPSPFKAEELDQLLSADCALSRPSARPNIGGIHVSSRTDSASAMAFEESRPKGQISGRRSRERTLGSERASDGGPP